MARRKKNPSAMATVLVLAALGVGGYLYYDKYERPKPKEKTNGKKKQPEDGEDIDGAFALDGNCMKVGVAANTKENQWVAASVMEGAFENYGAVFPVTEGPDGYPQMGQPRLANALGPPPGNEADNRHFVQAVGTAVFRNMVNPDCLAKMGLAGSEGAAYGVHENQNPYGPDFTYYPGDWPGDTYEYFNMILAVLSMVVAAQGYDFGQEGQTQAVLSSSPSWLLVA